MKLAVNVFKLLKDFCPFTTGGSKEKYHQNKKLKM